MQALFDADASHPDVCAQLLAEFAELCGPFSTVLRSIREELVSPVSDLGVQLDSSWGGRVLFSLGASEGCA